MLAHRAKREGAHVRDLAAVLGRAARAAASLGRNWIGCELNDDYAAMQAQRTAQACFAI